MSNFIKNYYSGFYDEEELRFFRINSGVLEQLACDMALNSHLTGCRERLDPNSFILIHNDGLYQVIYINEDTIIIQKVEVTSDNKYELVQNTLRIMNVNEYGEFLQETKY